MHPFALHRLYNQRISYHDFKTPVEVVRWLCALQAQDYPGAKWSIGLRLPGSTDAEIEQAIADKLILRTWLMRGTLHFVAAEDIHWMLELLSAKIIANLARRHQELELDEKTFKQSNDLLTKALGDGQQLTRQELLAILEKNGISTKGQRAPHLLQHASLHSLICHGVTVRNNPTYMLLPAGKSKPRDEAFAELARRYFVSRGPASLQDFIAWSGLITSEARAGLEAVKPELEEVEKNVWQPPSTPAKPDQHVYLLPGFDEYILGYRDRSAVLDPQFAQRIVPGGNGVFYPTIVMDGQVVGTWKREIKKDTVTITPHPFTSFSDTEEAAIAAAVPRYVEYLGLDSADGYIIDAERRNAE